MQINWRAGWAVRARMAQVDEGGRRALSWKLAPGLYVRSKAVPQMPLKPSCIASLVQCGEKTKLNGGRSSVEITCLLEDWVNFTSSNFFFFLSLAVSVYQKAELH